MTERQLANKIIKKLTEAGYDADVMLRVLKMACEKYEKMKIFEFEEKYNVEIVERVVVDEVRYRVHGYSSTESLSKLEAIKKYLT